jgi:TPR repeat protein
MAADKHSVVLHYDQHTDRLVVFSLPQKTLLEMRDGAGFEVPLDELRPLDHDEAEKRVGASILELVESLSGRKLGLRNYQADVERDLENWIKDAEKAAASGTPQAQYDLAVLYQDLALRRKSTELMARAKSLVELSAKAGVAEAKRALEHWEIFQRRFDRKLAEE